MLEFSGYQIEEFGEDTARGAIWMPDILRCESTLSNLPWILTRMRKSGVPLASIGAALISLVMASCTPNKGDFLLTNKSNETIARATVSVCNQTIELNGIQPNKSASGFYEVRSDSHYDVTVEFGSGKTLRTQIGYVTHGLDYHDEVVVTDSGIEISDAKTKTQ